MMDVEAALVSDSQPAEFVEPCETSFDDPAMASESLRGIDTAPRDPGSDVPTPACFAAAVMIVGLVGMQLVGPPARSATLAADGGNGVDEVLEWRAVMDIGAGQEKSQRDALPVRRQVAFCARPAAIRWVGTGREAPLLAAIDEPSTQARLQSIRSASRKRRSNSRCNRSQTPHACQSRRRRQHVTPEPQPSSNGSICHGMPVRSTNKMPVRAARAETRGRPPRGINGSAGSSGSTINHRESGTSGLAIPSHESHQPRRTRVLKPALTVS